MAAKKAKKSIKLGQPSKPDRPERIKAPLKVKKKKPPKSWAENHKVMLDTSFETIMTNLQSISGRSDVVTATDAEKLFIGIPLPALSACYLWGLDIYPLSRIVQITGYEGSNKSSLMFEIARWHIANGGYFFTDENESKDNPILRRGVIRDISRVGVSYSNSLEEWQNFLLSGIEQMKALYNDPKGPGATIPACFGIDGITSMGTEERIEKVKAAGFAGRDYSSEALSISSYMKVMPPEIRHMPISVVATNHRKEKLPKEGQPAYLAHGSNVAGGRALRFMESLDIEMTKIKTIERADDGGNLLKMTSRKNSNAPGERSIDIYFLWWVEENEETGEWHQVHLFDWYSASIELLLDFKNDKSSSKTRGAAIAEVVDLRDCGQRRVWSKALGIPESSPVKYHEAGEILEQNKDIINELYKILLINKGHTFAPGIDYRHKEAKVLEAIEADVVARYKVEGKMREGIEDDIAQKRQNLRPRVKPGAR